MKTAKALHRTVLAVALAALGGSAAAQPTTTTPPPDPCDPAVRTDCPTAGGTRGSWRPHISSVGQRILPVSAARSMATRFADVRSSVRGPVLSVSHSRVE